MWWLFYDPLTLFSLILVYVVGFAVLMFAAGYLAPRVARKVASRFTLQASMLIIGLSVVLSGLAGIGLIANILAGFFEAEITTGVIVSVITLIVLLNAISYFLSPLTINLMYGAKSNPELQKMVNEVAATLNLAKPPKAVIVRGPPNAFAYGNFLFGKYVAVSSSLASITPQEELKAIIGHELGHHKHRDNAIMLFMGIIPSVLYFMGIFLVRAGMITGYARSYYSGSSNRRGGGLPLLLAGLVAVSISFIVQVLVLAFSRLREYYADSAGAYSAGPVPMQRALARIHLYYSSVSSAKEIVSGSKLRTLFIYAITEALANPFYHYTPPTRDLRNVDIDRVVEQLKRTSAEEVSEFFSTHPPIPKRLRFLDTVVLYRS
ncbi:MAG: zinc metalloprotease HtpX [Desulfurococcaceae archaeon]